MRARRGGVNAAPIIEAITIHAPILRQRDTRFQTQAIALQDFPLGLIVPSPPARMERGRMLTNTSPA